MPIFEYHCNDCDQDFETLVSQGEEATSCNYCSGANLSKKFSCFATTTGGKVRSSASSGGSCGSCSSHSCSTCGM